MLLSKFNSSIFSAKLHRSKYLQKCRSMVTQQQPSSLNWREAASVMVLSKNSPQTTPFDYSILMVERSSKSTFMPSSYVFPGGAVDMEDYSPKWSSLFARCGIDESELERSVTSGHNPPPMITDSVTVKNSQDFLDANIGLRISAIRETFEEAGILLLTTPDKLSSSTHSAIPMEKDELTDWQLRVRKDASAFYALCDRMQMVPNIWSLYLWSNWLTPVLGHLRRFDTIFFLCCLDERPKVQLDNAEVTKKFWSDPLSIIEEHSKEKAFLAPPQIYELSRLIHFQEMEKLKGFAQEKQAQGTERMMPLLQFFDDGTLTVLPGDCRYPPTPSFMVEDTEAFTESNTFVDSIDTTHNDAGPRNRVEIRNSILKPICDVQLPNGHLAPLTYPEQIPAWNRVKAN